LDLVLISLRNGLSRLTAATAPGRAIKKDAVATAFLKAVELWPKANPSDLWWFLVYRAFCDPYNHPAQFARLNLDQSWKRTAGWALEEVLVRHYGPLRKHIQEARLTGRIEADKVDVLLTGDTGSGPRFFGVVHVKASFAERRTDDVPLSEALARAGYTSPLWTMDCKSSPATHPLNRGELGRAHGKRGAKRKTLRTKATSRDVSLITSAQNLVPMTSRQNDTYLSAISPIGMMPSRSSSLHDGKHFGKREQGCIGLLDGSQPLV